TPIPGLPTKSQVNQTVPTKGVSLLKEGEYNALTGLPERIVVAHGQVDSGAGGGTKKRGLPGARKEVPRNRSLQGHFVVNAVASMIGPNRLADSMAYTVSLQREMAVANTAKFLPGEVDKVAGFMDEIGDAQASLLAASSAYKTQAAKAAGALPLVEMG